MARIIGKLTNVGLRKLKAGMHSDGGGLYAQISAPGIGSWLFRYAVSGRERYCGLGSLDTVSLADARQEALRCRQMRLQGVDPIEARKSERAAAALAANQGTTFKEVATALIASKSAGWRNEKHQKQWRRTLEVYAYPTLATLPASGVATDHVLKVLEPIWRKKPETAARVRGRIEAVLDAAKARGIRQGENPARWKGHLDQLLPSRNKVRKVRHHPALPYAQLGGFMAALREREGLTSDALEFTILTAARTCETAGMRVQEIDFAKADWTVPAGRMKGEREHIVPLSTQAAEILRKHASGKGADALVFPGENGRQLSDMTLSMVHRRLGDYRDNKGQKITTHGFRSTFRDWAGDCTSFPRELIEVALSHAIEDETEAAYRRSTAIEKRRELMKSWANFCERATPANVDNVVAIRAAL